MQIYEFAGISVLLVLLSFLVGILFQGIQRKLVARFQHRIGPPVFQPLYDILKLLSKETIIPRSSVKPVFVISPFVALAAMVTAVLLVPVAGITFWGFTGDVIVLLYVFVLASIGIIVGASASGSPFSAVGASREITLLISLKLPLSIAVLSAAFIAKSFSIGAIAQNNTYLLLVGALAYFLCMLGELGRAPFHVSEAETEIVEGVYTEYSGRLLAAYKIAESFRFYALPMLFAALFLPIPDIGAPGMLVLQLGFAFIAVVVSAVVEAVSARFKIQHVSGFYLKGVLALALIQMAIALLVPKAV